MLTATVIPAYGAKYSTADEVIMAWEEGKDFKILGGPYCSSRDQEGLVEEFGEVYAVWSEREPPLKLA